MQFTNKKLLLFDFDGTLIDSVPDLAASVNFMLKQLNREIFDEDTIRSWVGNGAKTLVKRAIENSFKNNTQLSDTFFQKALDIFLTHYKNNLCNNTQLYDNVAQTLHKLHKQGYTLAIITNKPYDFIAPILQSLQLNELFTLLLGADSLQEKKPHPQPLLYACEKLGFTPNEALMIGDSKNDILAAQAAEIESVGVTYGYNYDEDISTYKPDAIINDFSKLLKLLSPKIAIVGGGVAGSSVAIFLAELGLDVTLFEKNTTLVDGPPICHLHAGGNLYREISQQQCLRLLRESIELIHLYPYTIDMRPTVLITPKTDPQNPQALLPRLERLKQEYAALVAQDPKNKVLGEVDEYYRVFTKEEILALKEHPLVEKPQTFDEWMVVVAKEIDLKKVQFPFIMVQEYGLNIFRLAASASLMLQQYQNATVLTNTQVDSIKKKKNGYELSYNKNTQEFDYLINAAGFKSGEIDDMLGIHRERFVEFKAAYVTQCGCDSTPWPEVIFYGERGTPQGMAQFTPYKDGYFQLHGMTKDITLFDDGLIKSSPLSAQPKLDAKFLEKIYSGWQADTLKERTRNAIKYMSQYIPSFANATCTQKPLYGAQQIPGDDADLRAAEVSFNGSNYARCEIVKASSVLSMADTIVERFHLIPKPYPLREFLSLESLSHTKVDEKASSIAITRNYPKSLAYLNNPLCYNTTK